MVLPVKKKTLVFINILSNVFWLIMTVFDYWLTLLVGFMLLNLKFSVQCAVDRCLSFWFGNCIFILPLLITPFGIFIIFCSLLILINVILLSDFCFLFFVFVLCFFFSFFFFFVVVFVVRLFAKLFLLCFLCVLFCYFCWQ